ncbi:CGMP-dependent protein Kinase [Phytophthora palmivora]|uniref:cGMP-dependent protein kinase n=1 Tax=Phytophthora palmivora TaxID=4796 RepID=A0A2P4Y8B7_9STRA|nr:CGMP-dependent protein Kinase [Phytophthora palmivora]
MDFSKRMKDLILPPSPPTIKPSTNSAAAATTTTVQLNSNVAPPVLSVLDLNEHKGVRRAPIKEEAVEPGDLDSTQHIRVPKNNQTRAMITKALKAHYLFSSLDQGEIDEMIDVMAMVTIQAGEAVIAQGTSGKCFYVLESGNCDIVIDGKLVGTYTNGDAFGELALLYNCPRAATIRATTGCILWTVERTTFRKIMATTASATQLARVNFLKNVELLQRLSNNQLQKVAAALKLQRFSDGDYIIRQGEDGNTFYIIVEGTVRCTSRTGSSDEAEKELMTLQRGNYFGEMALVLNEPRQANCIAVGPVDCYVMDRSEFTKLLGPLRSLIDRQMRIRVLRSVPLLSSLTDDELDILAHALNVVSFEDKSTIIKEGDSADTFYMISDGKVSVRKSGIEIMQLRSGEFFGERALLANEPRAADCIAVGRVECLTLQRAAFEQLLGKLEHIMQREIQRQQLVQQSVMGGRSDLRAGTATPTAPPAKKILYKDLDKIRTIGTGTFGRVIIVRHRPTNQAFALKCMSKALIVETHQQKNVMYEKGIIAECDHPFILKLHETYQDANQLYMLFELVQGGELWSLLYEKAFKVAKGVCGAFDISAARFYTANVVEALRYLQKMTVAYRDLKPENLVIDSAGYLKMVDFGFAKHVPYYRNGALYERSFTLCGTPEYLAPELVLNKGHGKAVDHWALGCLLYELIAGRTPFQHNDQNKIFEKILQGRAMLKFPPKFDPDAKDLVMKLLETNPALRIGSLAGGMQDVVNHPFFTNAKFDWAAMVKKTMKAPYTPAIKDAFDAGNFDAYPEDTKIRPFTGSDTFEGF